MGGGSMEDELSIFGLISDGDCRSDFDTYGGVALMAVIVLYTFKVLASVCDGHLTSCLEKIVEKFGIPEDVAGATFLAMSSSAPELFHSVVSTFVLVSPSGVGNIVGSALFNLLCIIGVLPLCSKTGPLKIWWYPTMRDAFFYSMAVAELFLVILDGKVVWWEALIMVLSYLSYVVYFYFNERIVERFKLDPSAGDGEAKDDCENQSHESPPDTGSPSSARAWLDRNWLRQSSETSQCMAMLKQLRSRYREQFSTWQEAFSMTDQDHDGFVDKDELAAAVKSFGLEMDDQLLDQVFMEGDLNQGGQISAYQFASVLWDGAVLQRGADGAQPMLMQLEKARQSIQQKFESAEVAFKATDSDGSGSIDLEKLKGLLRTLELDDEEDTMQEEIFRAIDMNCDGRINVGEFQAVVWDGKLNQSGESSVMQINCIKRVSQCFHEAYGSCSEAFRATDTNNSGVIEIDELITICKQLMLNLEETQIKELFQVCDCNKTGGIEEHQFDSVLWGGRLLGFPPDPAEEGDRDEEEEDDEEPGPCDRYDPSLIFINLTMPPYKYIVLAFTVVVFWVAFFTYIMVDAANRFGCFIQVPHVVMGLIVLAAGTSVPDMVASIAVARAGSADMAAANAVGSNTFDILLGLGLPWLIRCTAYSEEIEVPTEELIESIGILAFSLVFYLVTLRINGWMLNRVIGGILLSIYTSAVAFILVRHYTYFRHLETYDL